LTRLKPRKRDKIIAGFSEIDKKFNTAREDPKNTTIKELENQMDDKTFGSIPKLGKNSQKNFVKRMNKTHKGLR